MSEEQPYNPHEETPLQAEQAESESSLSLQDDKPVAQSSSPGGEEETVHEGEARPADPQDADDVLTHKLGGQALVTAERNAADVAVLVASRQRTRRAFVGLAAGVAAAYGFRRYLQSEPTNEMIPSLLRRNLDWNADVSRDVLRDHALAPTYPSSMAQTLRVNGVFGLKKDLVPESYRLQVVGVRDAAKSPHYVPDVTAWNYAYKDNVSSEDQGHDTKTDPSKMSSIKMAPEGMQQKCAEDENHTGRKPRGLEEAGESFSTLGSGTPGLLLQLDDFISKLPRYEMVLQFKCIEGWSQIVQWAGVRFSDFLAMFPPALIDGKEPRYIYMETPDGDYYVGYDLHNLRHPQALLVTEMMGQPLTQYHGAPLRLYTPTKYGYKQIKRIGLIAYTNRKPDDYWTELGYDWYGGL
jgi:hypothetical protein